MRQRRKDLPCRIPCGQCDKTFSKVEHLNRHQLAHTGERPYKCPICTKHFARRDVLLRHRRNHSSDDREKLLTHSRSQGQGLAQKPQGGSLEIGINGSINDIVISPLTAGNTYLGDIEPMTEESQLPDIRRVADSNTEFLGMLFNSPFGEQFTSNDALDNSPSGNLAIDSLVHPAMDVFDGRGDTTNARINGENLTGIRKVWPGNPQSTTQPHFWQEIAFHSAENIFSSHSSGSSTDLTQILTDEIDTVDTSLTGDITERLRRLKKNILTCPCNNIFVDQATCGQRYLCINTTEVFDQGIYLYLHKYQPSYPVLHPSTFKPGNVSELLLFVMCTIGISFLRTEDAAKFIRQTYRGVLNEVFTQFVFATTGSRAPAEIMNHLVLAHHMLFIFISTGGNLAPEMSQALYVHTMMTAQQHGFFAPQTDEGYEHLLPSDLEASVRWMAWSRVESTKNLIIGLVLHDSWLSDLFTMSPVIRTDAIRLLIPEDNTLYLAPTSRKWAELLSVTSQATQILELSAHDFKLPSLKGKMHAFSLYGLLCTALLRVTADAYRLIRSSDLSGPEQHHYVPWNILRLDKRGSVSAPILTEMIQLYDDTFRNSNPNCIVIWHSVCILITVDIDILGRAAGRDGAESMVKARQALTSWVQTASARRACVHAAQTFRILSHRKPADGTAFQSVRTLFMAALVLGVYILTSPKYSHPDTIDDGKPFDLANASIDWKEVGDEGFSSSESSIQDNTEGLESDAVKFIRFGGPIVIDRKIYHSGARHAQRIILEFANLLDEVGTHWMADYARLLYMIHDTMAG